MRMERADAWDRLCSARVLRLSTADAGGRPHVVPCTFAVDDSRRLVIGVDNKPKASRDLRRLRNIEENPRVSLIADDYSEEWDQLWWVRADGTAAVERSGPAHRGHWDDLRAKYRQYAGQILDGPVIVVTIEVLAGWTA
jgi:PPOX class probable F420-dependent enzyme